jgi:LacI family transcriptional regulator
MQESSVTIKDVAQAAGVSSMSVSRVINDKPGVGEETRARIQNAILALGFRPNRIATSLRQGRGLALLGLVIPDPYSPLFTSIAVAANDVLRERGLMVVSAAYGRQPGQERAIVESFVARGFDGVLLFSEDADHRYLGSEVQRGRPVAFLGAPPTGIEAPTVLVDNRAGARQAVEHLLEHGHRRIGIIASATGFPASERLAGYRQTLASHGIAVDPAIVQIRPHDSEGGAHAARALLELPDPPTAIFSTNYLLTTGALKVLRESRDRPAFVAFDDFEAAALADPPVTVVTQHPHAMGRAAAELVLAEIDGVSQGPSRVVIPTHVIPRGSGETLAPRG